MHVCPTMDYVDRAWEDAKQGRPSTNPMLECTIPTAYDDSIAPPGKHIMCIFAQYAPYTLRDAAWDQAMKSGSPTAASTLWPNTRRTSETSSCIDR
jgi:phytoene dehydrogenase-like protein